MMMMMIVLILLSLMEFQEKMRVRHLFKESLNFGLLVKKSVSSSRAQTPKSKTSNVKLS